MGLLERLYNNLFAEIDVYHVIRLVVIVGGYLILRARTQEWLKNRQLKAQLEHDKQERAQELVDRPEDQQAELDELTGASTGADSTWGWGKQTRKRNQEMQRRFEQAVETAAVEAQFQKDNNDSDDDIAEFLED